MNHRQTHLFQKDGFQGGVQICPHILQETGFTETDSVLQTPQEVLVRQLDYIQSCISLLE